MLDIRWFILVGVIPFAGIVLALFWSHSEDLLIGQAKIAAGHTRATYSNMRVLKAADGAPFVCGAIDTGRGPRPFIYNARTRAVCIMSDNDPLACVPADC